VPLSMTTAGRAAASMAVGCGASPSAHASAGVARWRSIGGRDVAPPPARPIESSRSCGGGGCLIRGRVLDRVARARDGDGEESWSAGEIWGGGDGEDEVIWLTKEAGTKQGWVGA
jgi:hypothetical protein